MYFVLVNKSFLVPTRISSKLPVTQSVQHHLLQKP